MVSTKTSITSRRLRLSIVGDNHITRIRWADIRSCSTEHGCGKKVSDLVLNDGQTVQVQLSDLAQGWSGRISQLYHIMIKRYSNAASVGLKLVSIAEFFAHAQDDYEIAPNLEDHPGLDRFREALDSLEASMPNTQLFLRILDDDEMVAVGVVVVTQQDIAILKEFADEFGADGVVKADDNVCRALEHSRLDAMCGKWCGTESP